MGRGELPAQGFNSRAVHAGQDPDPATGAVVPPVYLTSTYVQAGIGRPVGDYEYSRVANPSRSALEQQIAELEEGTRGFAFSSGMSAIDAVLRALLKPGDRVVAGTDAYGGTLRLLARLYEPWGVATDLVDFRDAAAVAIAASRPGARLVIVESPSNPLLNIADIAALAAVTRQAGIWLAVDNTLASPFLQRPLTLGADIVLHSTTKYLGGHSDVMGGAAVVTDADLADRIGFVQFAAGAIAAPMDAWLTARAIKSLGVRMERHCSNAMVLAEWLSGQPAIDTVYYPGLPTHPGHAVARRQMSMFGGMVSIKMRGRTPAEAAAAARRLAESTRVFHLAESLGGVESLIAYPSVMSHASQRGTPLAVDEAVVRLSVGIEDVADLTADLEQALRA